MPKPSRRRPSEHAPTAAGVLGRLTSGQTAQRNTSTNTTVHRQRAPRKRDQGNHETLEKVRKQVQRSRNKDEPISRTVPATVLRAFLEHDLHEFHIGKVSCYNVTREFTTPFFTEARMVDTDSQAASDTPRQQEGAESTRRT